MKKICMVLVIVLAVSLFAMSASAGTINEYEQSILDKVSTKVVLQGKTVETLPDWINQAKAYLLQDGVDVTETQAAEINGYIDEAIAKVKAAGEVKSNNLFDMTTNKDLLDLATKAAAVVGLRVTNDGLDVTIVDPNEPNVILFQETAAVKVTGGMADYTMIVVMGAAMVAVLVASVAVSKKVRAK